MVVVTFSTVAIAVNVAEEKNTAGILILAAMDVTVIVTPVIVIAKKTPHDA